MVRARTTRRVDQHLEGHERGGGVGGQQEGWHLVGAEGAEAKDGARVHRDAGGFHWPKLTQDLA